MFSHSQKQWLQSLNEQLPAYLQKLEVPGTIGRFLPCLQDPTPLGREMALGFSCLALKTYYMLGLWDTLDSPRQRAWLHFIKSYQIQGRIRNDAVTNNAFVDKPLYNFLEPQRSWSQKLREVFKPEMNHTFQQKTVIAETKQAIATLIEVGDKPAYVYLGAPRTIAGVRSFFEQQDWSKPWGAGGQTAALVVFLKTQAGQIAGSHTPSTNLIDAANHFYTEIADQQTGLYFIGDSAPQYYEAINGAMKVLTALDWLETPIHYPQQLMDTCLSRLPSAEGCHLVDAVYVLYRCLQQTDYKRKAAQEYCARVLDMIVKHQNLDGGFSYSIGRSQTSYYGAPITNGSAESDIHGTILLTWALAMIGNIMEDNFVKWKVIKP